MDFKERSERFRSAREDHNKNGKESMRIVEGKADVKRSTIYKLEKADDETNVGYQDIVKLANYYGVNVAWLMGQSTSPSLDDSSQAVTKTTGLSPKAIENLQKITDEDEKRAMNQLLESDSFRTVVTWLSLAENMIQRENITEVESWDEKREIESTWDNSFNVEMKLSPKESARYFLSRAIQTTNDALTLLVSELWTLKVTKWAEKVIKEGKKNGKRNKKN